MTLNINNLRPKFRQAHDHEGRLFDKIKTAVKSGKSAKTIAGDLGISQSTVLNILNKNGTCLKELRS